MAISRRHLLRQVAATGVATVTAQAIGQAIGAVGPPQIDERRASDGLIRLDRNENPYGPSAAVTAAIHAMGAGVANRYPAGVAASLRAGIAAAHGVGVEQVVLGCGSTDILRMSIARLAGSGKNVVAAVPTCDLVERFAEQAGVEVSSVPLDNRYAHDLDAILARIDASTGLVYICNPNSPTGTLTRRQDIE